jgi:hypothetical protein
MRVGIILILLIFSSILISGCSITGEYINVYDPHKFKPEKECVLSLCDCQCYPQGSTPEEQENKMCGNDCYGIYHIDECVLKDSECVIKYKKNVVKFGNRV